MQTFTCVPTPGAPGLGLTPAAQAALGWERPERAVLAHGARRALTAVAPVPDGGAVLPVAPSVAAVLGLVPGVPYRLRRAEGEVRIGPVVGILAARRSAQIDLSPGGLPCHYLLRYPAVGGLVYLFGGEDVDLKTETIEGYYWAPADGSPGTPADGDPAPGPGWERALRLARRVRAAAVAETPPPAPHPRTARFQDLAREFLAQAPPPAPGPGWSGTARLGCGRLLPGRFPFPGAIWRRSSFLPRSTRERLVARLGPRLFNSRLFDKEEAHRLLSADPAIAPHLPATAPFTQPDLLFALLARDGAAILKQRDGNSGYGLMRIECQGDGYLLRVREQGAVEPYPGRPELERRLAPVLAGGRYLVQQWVDLPVYRGRLNDYRVMMQKDDRGGWVPRGAIGRFGQAGRIVSNFVNRGYALPAGEALGLAFGVDGRTAYCLEAGLLQFAAAVCASLDRTGGCYGDLGLDIGLDRQQRLWLFEVNKLPCHELPLYMGDPQMYLEVKSGPLLFAAHLAGFGR